MTDRELMQQALDALETKERYWAAYRYEAIKNIQAIITALRERLAQPEPVTGNLLKDAYNAMVEKKTRSQKLREAGFTRRPKGWEKEKDEQEPVAWMHTSIEDNIISHRPADLKRHPERWTALYPDPPPCPTCEALARTVMLDQTSHDNNPQQRKPLTEEEIYLATNQIDRGEQGWSIRFVRAIEAAHGIKP